MNNNIIKITVKVQNKTLKVDSHQSELDGINAGIAKVIDIDP